MALFIARNSANYSSILTILQLAASAGKPLRIHRAWVNQSNLNVSTQIPIQLMRTTTTATVSSLTPVKLDPSSGACVATSGHTATAEGTPGDILLSEGFSVLNGWLYFPTPEGRIIVPAGGFLALKFTVAPPAALYHYGIEFEELG